LSSQSTFYPSVSVCVCLPAQWNRCCTYLTGVAKHKFLCVLRDLCGE
jgi:hypothetical protein